MVEGEGPALLVPPEHQLRQLLILLTDDGEVLLCQGGGVTGGADHRLHAQLREAQIQHLLYVLEKIGVCVGEGAPHVIVLSAPGGHQLLKFGDDPLPAAVSGVVHPVAVVDLLAAVQTEHHIAHLPVGKVDHILVDQKAVGGQSKAEILVVFLLNAPGVGHQILDHLEVHQRLAAEEIHLQIPARA